MMTVHKCQAVVVTGRWRNPRVKLMAIIVASVSIDPLDVRAVQNVLVPFVSFHDGSPAMARKAIDKTISMTMFSKYLPPCDSIADRPATAVNKICASP
jgi:hypothetical protein